MHLHYEWQKLFIDFATLVAIITSKIYEICIIDKAIKSFMKNVNSFLASGNSSSADNLCKQFGPRSGSTEHRSLPGSKQFDTLIVFLKEYFEKSNFKKSLQAPTKASKNYPACKELI